MDNKHLIYFLIILFPSPDFLFSFFTAGFECFVCNTNSDNDDTEPCIEKVKFEKNKWLKAAIKLPLDCICIIHKKF